jgi:2',3'-cyclic-nucleotide 2'-phosphodiesterase (5'-nucleotidase family)
MRVNVVKATLVLLTLAAAAWAGQPLTILFFNDFHAHLEPFEAVKGEGEVGGIGRLAGVADEIRATNEVEGVPTFLLIAGDVLQGTPYSTVYRGEAEFACLNEMAVTAMCVGNHEFDYGQENLRDLMEFADFPVISANIRTMHPPGYEFTTPMLRLEAGDKSVLVIGLSTPETPITTAPRNVAGLKFDDPAKTAQDMIIGAGEADAIIALTHLGFENDLALAKAVPDLDVVVGGHTHTKVTEPAKAGGAVVVSAYEYGIYLGRLDLDIGDAGDVSVTAYELIPIIAASPDDEAVEGVLAGFTEGLSDKLSVVVGHTETVLSRDSISRQETNFGDFVADLTREAAGADLALVNAGGVRADLGPGDITLGDVLTALPFGNEIVVLDVPGTTLREAFEFCVREKVGEGGFLQISGCEYKAGPGDSLEITVGGKVAMPDFLAEGGDGYAMFAGNESVYKTGAILYDVVASGLREGRPVPTEAAGRIVIEGR